MPRTGAATGRERIAAHAGWVFPLVAFVAAANAVRKLGNTAALALLIVLSIGAAAWWLRRVRSEPRRGGSIPDVAAGAWTMLALVLAALGSSRFTPVLLVLLPYAVMCLPQSLRALRSTPRATVFPAFAWAAVIAFFVLYARTALGYIMPVHPPVPQSSPLPAAYFLDGFLYDKSHIRKTVLQYLLLTAAGFAALLSPVHAAKRSRWAHPATPLAVLLAGVANLGIPPLKLDPAHWSHWVGPALAMDGRHWPYLDFFSYYGVAPVGLLSAWLKLFAFDPLSLASLLTLLGVTSALLLYAFLARATRSPWLALSVVAVLLLVAYDYTLFLEVPNHSPLRYHLYVVLVLWLGYGAIRGLLAHRSEIRRAAALGLLTMWSPVDGVFLTIGFMGVCAARLSTRSDRRRLGHAAGAFVAGAAAVPLVAVLARGSVQGTAEALRQIVDFLGIFPAGYGYHSQYFDATWLLFLAGTGALLVYLGRKVLLGRALGRHGLFTGFVLVILAPYFLQSIGRSPVNPNGILWVVLPAVAVVFGRAFTLAADQRPFRAAIVAAAAITLVFTVGNPAQRLVKHLHDATVSREIPLNEWSNACLVAHAAGTPCADPDPLTLHGLYTAERSFPFEASPHFLELLDACQRGVRIVDILDSFVYERGHCRPATYYQSFFSVSTRRQAFLLSRELRAQPQVLFGNAAHWRFQQNLVEQLASEWLAPIRAGSACEAGMSQATEFTLSPLDESTFRRGISREGDKLRLAADRGILCRLVPGTTLHFAGGAVRTVLRTDEDTVHLAAGTSLGPARDGYPHRVQIAAFPARPLPFDVDGPFVDTALAPFSFSAGCPGCFPPALRELAAVRGAAAFGSFGPEGDATVGSFSYRVAAREGLMRLRFTLGPGSREKLGVTVVRRFADGSMRAEMLPLSAATAHQENAMVIATSEPGLRELELTVTDAGARFGEWIGVLGIALTPPTVPQTAQSNLRK